MLRAIRRPKASGSPSGLSKGSTVTASAPPTPAANAATVVRSMLTQGSYRLIIGRLVTAWIRIGTSAAPLSSSIRAHSRRAARSLAMVGNCAAVAANRNSTSTGGLLDGEARQRPGSGGTPPRRPARDRAPGRRRRPGRGRSCRRPRPPGRRRPARSGPPRPTWSPAASAPRLVPSAGSVSPSRPASSRAASGVASWRTTGARSSSTPSSSTGRSAAASTHSDVAPVSRSASACSLSAGRVRTSQPPRRSAGRG